MKSNKNKNYQAIAQREEKNDTYMQNCIKMISLSENFVQQIKIIVKLWKVRTISQVSWAWSSRWLSCSPE